MPIFEYKCKSCSKVFDYLQLPGRHEEAACPECGGTDLNKLISAPFLPSSVGRPANDDFKTCDFASQCRAGGCAAMPDCGQPADD